jgi:hypothetical protein
MDRQEKGTAVGATGGAVVGAAVGGPVGAAVGAGVGGYAGHYESDKMPLGDSSHAAGAASPYDAETVRFAQRALNHRGFNAGPVDGVWGPSTESALVDFQRSENLAQTGRLDPSTMDALGAPRLTTPR